MEYTSAYYYIFFLGTTFLLYTAMPKKVKWRVLLAASMVFYCCTSRWLVGWLLWTTATIYVGARLIARVDGQSPVPPLGEVEGQKHRLRRKKRFLVGGVVLCNIVPLLVLKYFNFFGTVAHQWIPSVEFSPVNFVLPLGISYYTLQAISYVVDVYRKGVPAEKNFFHLLLFLSFFPQITEGPLGRYNEMAPRLLEGHSFSYTRLTFGAQLMLWGLFKKMVVADRAFIAVKAVFSHSDEYSALPILVATLLFTLQLYCEFSGVMDIVRGSAELFGVSLPQNFNQPFFSASVGEFWRRWHITLGQWIRDYVFYPVSMSALNRKWSKWGRTHISHHVGKVMGIGLPMLCVWVTNGMWHGAGYKYIAYGLYYFVLVMTGVLLEPVFARLTTALHIPRKGKGMWLLGVVRTFLLVNLGMLIFRAENLHIAYRMVKACVFRFTLAPIIDGTFEKLGLDRGDWLVLLLGTILLLIVGILREKKVPIRARVGALPLPLRWSVYLCVLFAVILLGAYGRGYAPVDLIYAQF